MYLRLLIVIGIIFSAHLLIWFTAVRFFAISDRLARAALFILAFLFSISFILSRLALNTGINVVTRAFYILSALWMGLVVNLLPAVILGWAVWLAGKAVGRDAPMRPVCLALFSAAFLFSAYGVWNAFHPAVKNIEVEMPGLPEKWQGRTIAQISDVHLGAVYSPEYFSKIAKKINSLKPDAIFITGDLFDGMSSDSLSSFAGPLDELKAPFGVFFVNGNHENYVGIDRVLSVLAKTKFIVLHDDVVNMDGLQIIGVDYPDFGAYRDVKKAVTSRKNFTRGAPTILLYHTPTTIAQRPGTRAEDQTRTYWAPETDFTLAKELGVNLQLSGHTHKGQMLPFVFLAHYLYKGYEYGLHKDGDFSIYTTSGLGSFGPPMRTGTTPEIVMIKLKKRG